MKEQFTRCKNVLLVVGLGLSALTEASSIQFQHKDWVLACDNTGTCRAAGYQSDQHEQVVSVLLTRKAGANEGVTAQVNFDSEHPQSYGLRIQGRHLGKMNTNSQGIAQLTPLQTQRLLASAQQNTKIEFFNEQKKWQLSDQGLKAILLKMDEVQKRVGTSSALISKGKASNRAVLAASPMPILQRVRVQNTPEHLLLTSVKAQNILAVLKKHSNEDNCMALFTEKFLDFDRLSILVLNSQYSLVTAPCWYAAYNMGQGAWLMDAKLSQVIQTVAYDVSSVEGAVLSSYQKSRGLADCSSQQQWDWDGIRFVRTLEQTTGLCKHFLGGAWELPTLIYQVK